VIGASLPEDHPERREAPRSECGDSATAGSF